MHTTICLDFGNTRLKCAVFENNVLSNVVVLPNDDTATIASLIEAYKPTHAILSSVIAHNKEIESLLAQSTQFHVLNYSSKLPFTSPVGKPETIGADRLALCAAAVHLYPKQHCLVIALGSCITYNYINKYHEFLGGAISPGMNMRFKAMHEQTALLPLIKAQHEFPLTGYDTATNMLSGVILGMAKEIDGIINTYKERYNNLQVMFTGGDMSFFEPHLQNKLLADPNLLYTGLYAISKHNLHVNP